MSDTDMWRAFIDILKATFGFETYPHSFELSHKAKELVHLRRRFEKLAAEHLEDADALEQIYQDEQRKIIEREPPESNRNIVGASAGAVPTHKSFKVPTT